MTMGKHAHTTSLEEVNLHSEKLTNFLEGLASVQFNAELLTRTVDLIDKNLESLMINDRAIEQMIGILDSQVKGLSDSVKAVSKTG